MRTTLLIMLFVVVSTALGRPAAGLMVPGWAALQRWGRALLQTPPDLFEPPPPVQTSGNTAQCMHYSAASLNNGLCVLAPDFLLSVVVPPPDSHIAKALTAVHARRRHCSLQRNTSSCYALQTSHSCYWAASAGAPLPRNSTRTAAQGAGCFAADYDAWGSFKANPVLSQAPLWAWCPNTDAWRYMRCSARSIASAAACAAVSGCVWDAPDAACRPTFLMARDDQQRQRWLDDFGNLAPSAAGNCQGVCWLRQLRASAAGGAAGAELGGLLGGSNWAGFLERAAAQCRDEGFLDRPTCAAVGYPSTAILTSTMNTYTRFGPLSGGPDGGC